MKKPVLRKRDKEPDGKPSAFSEFYHRNTVKFWAVVCAVFLVIVAGVLFHFFHYTNSGRNYGIDVSYHQGKIIWSEVNEAGVSFAFIRAGYRSYSTGELHEDSQFARNFRNSRVCAIKRGVYFYSQAITVKEAEEEADFVLDLVDGRKLDYPIFLDVEDTYTGEGRADDLDKAARTKIVKAFCRKIVEAGYQAGVYANADFLQTSLNTAELTDYWIWVAEYVDGSSPELWTEDYDFWQYTASGTCPGIEGAVDLDRWSK